MTKSSVLLRRNKGYFKQKVAKTLFGNSPLKGGVIGGGVTIISVALFYSCTLLDTSHGSFLCLPFLFISPMFPFAILFDKLDQIFQYQLPFILLPVVSIVSYFIIGSLVGSLIGYIKSKNKVAQ